MRKSTLLIVPAILLGLAMLLSACGAPSPAPAATTAQAVPPAATAAPTSAPPAAASDISLVNGRYEVTGGRENKAQMEALLNSTLVPLTVTHTRPDTSNKPNQEGSVPVISLPNDGVIFISVNGSWSFLSEYRVARNPVGLAWLLPRPSANAHTIAFACTSNPIMNGARAYAAKLPGDIMVTRIDEAGNPIGEPFVLSQAIKGIEFAYSGRYVLNTDYGIGHSANPDLVAAYYAAQ